jgi:metallophosphoesterase (TIGR00282 family)
VIEVASRRVAVVNLMGRVGMSPIDCPFRKADEVLADLRRETPIALVDMHAESTAESVAMGYHLDGRVSAVAGTHRHVQTADETILPGGTAYITDLGMTGPIESVLGLRPELMIRRLMSQMPVRLEVAAGRAAIHGAIITLDAETGRARAISRLRVTG